MPILAQDFGSLPKIFLSLPSGVLWMPLLTDTATREWLALAVQWRREHPGDPAGLSAVDRRGSKGARAAYFWAVREWHPPDPEVPVPVGCDLCGAPTYSWCEGCYSRCAAAEPYSGLCTTCDQQQLVCYGCLELQITYAEGHRAFLAQEAKTEETASEIQVTGKATGGGGLSLLEPAEWVTVDQVAAASGRSSAEIIDEITRALRTEPPSDRA